MKYATMIKKLLVVLLGVAILGVGIGINSVADLGSDNVTSLTQAIANIFGMQLGTMSVIVNLTICAITFLLYRKNLGVSTLIAAVTVKYPIDFVINHLQKSDTFIVNFLLCCLGTTLIAIGVAFVMSSKWGITVYESMIYSLEKRLKIKFTTIKYVVDALTIVATLLLGGKIGIGTVITYLACGVIIEFVRPYIDKIVKID